MSLYNWKDNESGINSLKKTCKKDELEEEGKKYMKIAKTSQLAIEVAFVTWIWIFILFFFANHRNKKEMEMKNENT